MDQLIFLETTKSKARSILVEKARMKRKSHHYSAAEHQNRKESKQLHVNIVDIKTSSRTNCNFIDHKIATFTRVQRRFFTMVSKTSPRCLVPLGTRPVVGDSNTDMQLKTDGASDVDGSEYPIRKVSEENRNSSLSEDVEKKRGFFNRDCVGKEVTTKIERTDLSSKAILDLTPQVSEHDLQVFKTASSRRRLRFPNLKRSAYDVLPSISANPAIPIQDLGAEKHPSNVLANNSITDDEATSDGTGDVEEFPTVKSIFGPDAATHVPSVILQRQNTGRSSHNVRKDMPVIDENTELLTVISSRPKSVLEKNDPRQPLKTVESEMKKKKALLEPIGNGTKSSAIVTIPPHEHYSLITKRYTRQVKDLRLPQCLVTSEEWNLVMDEEMHRRFLQLKERHKQRQQWQNKAVARWLASSTPVN